MSTDTSNDADPPDQPSGHITFFRSMRGKLTLVLTVFISLTTLILSIADYRYVRDMLRVGAERQLTLHKEGIARVLLAHVDQQHERVALVASRTRLRQLIAQYESGAMAADQLAAEAGRILNDARASTEGFRSISIVGVSDANRGEVLVSTEASLAGTGLANLQAFDAGRKAATLTAPGLQTSSDLAWLAAPARSGGELIAVVMVELEVSTMREILLAIPSPFSSTETRLGMREGDTIRYLFPTDVDGINHATPDNDVAMERALSGDSGFQVVEDMHGDELLQSFGVLGYRGWAIVSQVEMEEAYQPIQELRRTILLISAVVLLIGIVVAGIVARRFTQPILELATTAAEVGNGNLRARARSGGDDEVGFTARAFNSMTGKLVDQQSRLEDIVGERTRALEERTEQLTASHQELADLCRLLEDQAEISEQDLDRAEIIQRSLLPSKPPQLTDYSVQSLYRPGRTVGGDLFDVEKVDDRYLVMVLADASGHGVSAAMLSVLFKYRLQITDQHNNPLKPAEALREMNRELARDVTAPGVFFTCLFCVLDLKSGTFTFASAGHPPPACVRSDGQLEINRQAGPALGLYEEADYEEEQLSLARGDRVLLYTDGLFDIGPKTPAMADIAALLDKDAGGEPVLDHVFDALADGEEKSDRDDVTALLLTVGSGQSHFDGKTERPAATDKGVEHRGIWWATEDDRAYLMVEGRVNWTFGQALLDQGVLLMERDGELVVDLAECEYMDSTMLGTLHELIVRADEASQPVRLQSVGQSLRECFEELSLNRVIEHIGDRVAVPQSRKPLPVKQMDVDMQRQRLLRAHELLANLSEANRAQFEGVTEQLRDEISEGLQ